MSARELLASATPRPWSLYKGVDTRNSAVPKTVRAAVAGAWRFVAQANKPDGADAALIVAAVNEYEALLEIAETARTVRDRIGPVRDEWDHTDELEALDEALDRLDTLRAAIG